MWNIFKIARLSAVMWNRDETQNHYDDDLAAADVATQLYGEMLFPSNLITVFKFRRTERGRDILWGRKDKAKDYQVNEILPKITNKRHMDTYAPNTVGGHYHHLIRQWSFEELWNRRFSPIGDGWASEVRSNVSRHMFLSHDFWHVLFRYDTSQLGEACIQGVTHVMTGHIGPWYASHLMALKVSWKYKSMKPLRALRESLRLAKATKEEFWYLNPLEIIGEDVEVARSKYNIGSPDIFLSWAVSHEDVYPMDCIHPEYSDVQQNKAMAAQTL